MSTSDSMELEEMIINKEEVLTRINANDSNMSPNLAEMDSSVNKPNSEEDNSVTLNKCEGLSKKQRKNMEKKEKWLLTRKLKRAKEKEKQKIKKQIALSNNIKLGPSRKELKRNKMSTSNCKVHVVVDLSFNDLMNDKDLAKCVKQVHHCYSVNRRFADPMQFHVTSFGGRFEEDMKKHDGYRNWDIHFSPEHFLNLFEKDRLLYLTSDSENIISNLEDDKIYIIGGLVDHNSQKGMCLRLANEAGISHGQLPIGEYLQMSTRKTLTIDHVFEIMHGVCHGKTWEEALLSVIPARKGAQAKEKEEKDGEEIVTDTSKDGQEESKISNGNKEDLEMEIASEVHKNITDDNHTPNT